MLACGSVCRPTEVLREIQRFSSSTRPAKVATDAGDGFIKGMGNPQGPSSLISELVAAELGTWFGLKIPPFSIIRRCDIEIPMDGCADSMQPPMFFSSAVDGSPRDGGQTFLRKLQDFGDVSKLVVFDTWIRNVDRYYAGNVNSDNLIYGLSVKGKVYTLNPIDHSHCFVDVDFDQDLPSDDYVTDVEIYGLYPEFKDFITERHVADAIEKLRTLDRKFVEECINSVPPEWGLSGQSGANLIEFICDRAAFVVETAPMKLVDNPEFPGFGNAE